MTISIAFILIIQFYVKLVDIWASTEQLWEGAFSLLASILILIMGIAFLRMDRARVKWRYKLSLAFERSHRRLMRARAMQAGEAVGDEDADEREGEGGKWALFLLPFVTVLREGLEAVLFVSGVSPLQSVKGDEDWDLSPPRGSNGTELISGGTICRAIGYTARHTRRSHPGHNCRYVSSSHLHPV